MNTITTVIAVAVTTLSLASSSMALNQEKVPTLKIEEVQTITEKTFKEKLIESNLDERRMLVLERVKELSKGTSVNPIEVYSTVAKCENIALDTNLQSGHKYKYDNSRWGVRAGEQEKSFGLAMVHLPDHPTITREEATDPEFALSWMVQEFAAGRQSQWTCWRTLYGVK